MIWVNGQRVPINNFPDGTPRLNVSLKGTEGYNEIIWRYEGEFECMSIWCITKHIRSLQPWKMLQLYLPYVPNARMDRVKNDDEVFTLKWFADFINSLKFEYVTILDPHSNVTSALIDRVKIENPIDHIQIVLNSIENAGYTPILYFPDAGAMKRYEGMLTEYPFLYGEKKRDWETGKILGLNLKGDVQRIEEIENPVFLMIDDICSHGGTFYYSAKALKEAFPNSYINSWATHTENDFPTLQKAFDEGLILHHFTTNSLYSHTHDKIKVFFIC